MAQHPYFIENQSGASFRADLNNALAAIVTNNSGPSQPSPTYEHQLWFDSNTNELKIRNAANNAWITIATKVGNNYVSVVSSGSQTAPGFRFAASANTGLFSPTTNVVAITTNGSERVRIDASGNVGFGKTPTTRVDINGTCTATTFAGSGASLTALNANNIASGTVPTARLGTGTASATTFLRGDRTWAALTQFSTLGVGTPASGVTGQIRATNDIVAHFSSDIKNKENVQDIPNALDKVISIGGKLFDWKDDYIKRNGGEDGYFVTKKDFGVIAQDVQKVFPIAVKHREEEDEFAVDYVKLCALAFAAIKELKQELDELRGEK